MGNISPDTPLPTPTAPKEIPLMNEIPKPIEAPVTLEQAPAGNIAIDQSKLPPTDPSPTPEAKQNISFGSAEFVPAIRSLLTKCGIDPETINPVPVGEGANHIVYKSKDGLSVIKIPKSSSATTMNMGHKDEQIQIEKIQKAFSNFSLPTKIQRDSESNQYVVVQKAVEGKPVTNHTTDPGQLKQLKQIVELNNQLYAETGESLDFVGMPGFTSWIKRQFKKIIMRKSDFEVSNILIDEKTNRLFIIDTDVLRTRNVPLKTKLISNVGFFVNRMFMKWYFGMDIKRSSAPQGAMVSQPQPGI